MHDLCVLPSHQRVRRPLGKLLTVLPLSVATLPLHGQQFNPLEPNGSVEALNVFNRVNVQDIDQVYGAGEFAGPSPISAGDGVSSPANLTFGTVTFAGAARQIQLSLNLKF
jgi:hypothetical protein